MAKLQDLFSQARRAQSSSGMGFIGKSKTGTKPHAAALVVEFPKLSAGRTEAVLKAGADGVLYTWDGKDTPVLDLIKQEVASARASNEQHVAGLRITGALDTLNREVLTSIKELGIAYILLPFEAPARLLGVDVKDLEKIVSVPVRSGDLYPVFIRPLASLGGISAVHLELEFPKEFGSLTIEEVLHYKGVREAVHVPALLNVPTDLDEDSAHTLAVLGAQAVILTAASSEATTTKQITALRGLLEKLYQEEKENEPGSSLSPLRR